MAGVYKFSSKFESVYQYKKVDNHWVKTCRGFS